MEVQEKYLDCLQCLQKEFGYHNFRPIQCNIIRSIIEDGVDQCAIMSTGYGKSLTYQSPPVYLKKVAVVVSPIISLMEDQVRALNLVRERACLLGTAQARNFATQKRILSIDFNVVYMTPERITSDNGLELLRELGNNLVLVAVDETHCISQWGHDFRQAFRQLKKNECRLTN